MELKTESALIEAILFLESEPQDTATLARISGLSRNVVEACLESLKERLAGEEYGLELLEIGGGWLLTPKRHLWEQLRTRYGKKNDNKLSKAALETLSIIAYSQPVTRAEVENIRGVQADNMMRLLLQRELIQEVGRKDAPGKPVQYGTTRNFLKVFRLSSISELPKLDEADRRRFELDGQE
ncbi:MAG: SMC-Scp complex subunit ScpB [Spirochaetaceae bacterium]|nr:MAG: SMC-Scp complex subunit ScpB [Spirochaetaceae bacterium]